MSAHLSTLEMLEARASRLVRAATSLADTDGTGHSVFTGTEAEINA